MVPFAARSSFSAGNKTYIGVCLVDQSAPYGAPQILIDFIIKFPNLKPNVEQQFAQILHVGHFFLIEGCASLFLKLGSICTGDQVSFEIAGVRRQLQIARWCSFYQSVNSWVGWDGACLEEP